MATRKTSVVTEMGIFAIGLSIIIGSIVAIVSSMGIRPGPPVMGISRNIFIAAPLLGTCIISMVFGILLLITRTVWAVIGCVAAGGLITLTYMGVFFVLTGKVSIDLITLAMIAVPVLLIIRSPYAISEIRNGSSSAQANTPANPPAT